MSRIYSRRNHSRIQCTIFSNNLMKRDDSAHSQIIWRVKALSSKNSTVRTSRTVLFRRIPRRPRHARIMKKRNTALRHSHFAVYNIETCTSFIGVSKTPCYPFLRDIRPPPKDWETQFSVCLRVLSVILSFCVILISNISPDRPKECNEWSWWRRWQWCYWWPNGPVDATFVPVGSRVGDISGRRTKQ